MKGLKFFSAALIISFSASAFAGVGEIGSGDTGKTAIPGNRLREYQDAVSIALQQVKLKCTIVKQDAQPEGAIEDVIYGAWAAKIDRLKHELEFTTVKNGLLTATIKTSDDFREVIGTSFTITESASTFENNGTLANPALQKKSELQVLFQMDCHK